MAFYNVEFFSECLKRCVSFKVILPNDMPGAELNQKDLKTLYLLHGYSNMNYEWVWNSNIMELAGKYHLCVVLPSGENSFYLDGKATGRKYGTFIGEELPLYVQKTFGLSKAAEDNFLGGLSMGGFGAIHTALQYPERFGKLFALSSALIMYELEEMKPGEELMANYDYYSLMFGDLSQLQNHPNHPEEQIRRLKKTGGKIPQIYMACGREDSLLLHNRRFHDFLKKEGVEHVYLESTGNHDFVFWNAYLEPGIRWLLEQES